MKRRSAAFLVALAVGLALIAGACGGDDGDGDESSATTLDVGERTQITIPVEEGTQPAPGGSVIYATDAETDGWNPWSNRWAVAGVQVALTFYDPIAAFDENGVAQPYLAESFTPNEDFTQWEITVRPNITFHDGSPLTAEAFKNTLDNHKESLLTSAAVQAYESSEVVDDLTLQVTMNTPWAVFPSVLTAQAGVVPAPSVDPGALNRDPVGTGPFSFSSWTPDNSLVVERNDNYWRADEFGTGLPYLDRVEFQPVPDVTSRLDALLTGSIDMMYTTSSANIVALRDAAQDGEVQLVEDLGENEEWLVMLNTADGPMSDLRLREAAVLATDRDQVIDVVAEGIHNPAEGPFTETSPWYHDSGYPAPDPAAATALVEEWKAENDGQAPEIVLRTTNVPENLQTISLLAQQWEAVGFVVNEDTVDQQTLINNALGGDYDAQLWRQFGSVDPDLEWHWWHQQNANAIGELSLNMARNDDDELSAALDEARGSDDDAVRTEAYATVQERLTATLPYLWLYESIAAVGSGTSVRGITNGPLPSGDPSLPMGGTFPGATRMTQVWVVQ